MSNWWEDAPLAEEKAGGDWWSAAPLADEPVVLADRGPALEINTLTGPLGVAPSGGGSINSPLTERETPGFFDRLSNEAGQLRDEVFSGVDSAVAGVKTLNAGMLMRRQQNVDQRLQEANARGRGVAAGMMRGEAESLESRVPVTVAEAAQAQATSQRGSQMATRPAVAKLNEAKTWGEAWDAFTEAPYDVIAGVTAQSLPATLPGLVAAAAMGPAAGAVTMGLNSATVEAGSSLGEFARERGVDMTDAKAVQTFFSNRQNLSDAMAYAGKRAGIIGTLDAASGGMAGKTIAPAMKSTIARQAVNLPAQMGVQATLGAAGEAGGQIATKGRIDQPGQVLAEAVGEFGGAPAEVLAFSRDARRAFKPSGPPKVQDMPTVPQAPAAPAAPVVTVTTPDASKTAQSAPAAPQVDLATQAQTRIGELEAVDNIARILGQKEPDGTVLADGAQPAASPGAGSAVDAGSVEPGGLRADGAAGVVEPAGIPVGDSAEAVAAGDQPTGTAPVATLNDSGTLTIKGEPKSIIDMLRAGGVVSILPARNGVMVGANQAEQALKLIQGQSSVPNQTQPAVTPKAEAARTETPAATGSDAAGTGTASAPARADGVEAAGLTSAAVDAPAQPAQNGSAERVSEGQIASAETQNQPVSEPAAAVADMTGEQIDDEWTAFSPDSGSKAIPRAEMPQIKAEHRGAMVNFLNARGIEHESEVEIPAADLKPTQAEFSPAKVEKAKAFEGGDRSILISSDGHVLDGHHQWLAKLDAGESVKAIRLDAPIEKLIAEVKEFPSAEAADGATAAPDRPTAAAKPPSVPGGRYEVTSPEVGTNLEKMGHHLKASQIAGRKEGEEAKRASRAHYEKAMEFQALHLAEEKAAATKAKRAATIAAKQAEREQREIASRQDASAENFELGQDAEESISGQAPMFARSPAAQAAYEARIDALFDGRPANRIGARILDKSDMLGMLGYAELPVILQESKVVQGGFNHHLRAEHWKKIPQWLEEPAAVFESDTVPGRMVFVAPELVNGAPVLMAVEPDASVGATNVHLLVNAYDKDRGRLPVMRWASEGLTQYIDQKRFPAILATSGLQLPRVLQESRGNGRRVLGHADLVKFRQPGFKRGTQSAPGLTRSQIQRAVDKLTLNWLRKPDIHILDSMQDAPDPVREVWEQQNSSGASGDIEGFHWKGGVYLVADQLRGGSDVIRVLYHESLGHFGLRNVFGKDLDVVLRQIAAVKPTEMRAKAKQYGFDLNNERDRMSAAEELLAEFAQSRPENSLVQRAVAIIRKFLRENVPGFADLKLTDAEIIEQFLAPAREFVENGKRTEPSFAAPSFARQSSRDQSIAKDVVSAYQSGSSARQVGERFGLPTHTVYEYLKDAGVQRRNLGPSDERVTEAKRLYESGLTLVQVADRLGTSNAAIFNWLKGAGVELRPLLKYSDETRNEAVRMYQEGMSAVSVTEALGLGVSGPRSVRDWAAKAGVIRTISESTAMALQNGRVVYSGNNTDWESAKTGRRERAHSTYELLRMQQLDADESVTDWSKKTPLVKYTDPDGKQRTYAPDFIVKYDDGRTVIEEVKAEFQLAEPVVKLKIDAARKQFEAKGIEFRVLTQHDIGVDNIKEAYKQIAKQRAASQQAALESPAPNTNGATGEGSDSAMAAMVKKRGEKPAFARAAAAGQQPAAPARTVAEGYALSGRRTISKTVADSLPGLGLDNAGRIQLEVGAKIKDYLAEKSGPWWERLGMKGASPALKRQLRAMKLTVAKAQETAVAVAKEAQKLSAAEREMVSDLIEQEVQAGTVPPQTAVRLAQIISTSMEAQTDELVRLGMLTKDSADKWRGKYLPRYYKSKLLPGIPDAWGDALRGLRGKTSAMKGIKGKHLKGRGMNVSVPESQIADYEALGWEVRDDDFNPSIDGDGTVNMWRDFTRAERDAMGEIRDSGFRFVMGYMATQKDIALGRMFEGMAGDPEMSSRIAREGMDVRVPDGTVEGTGAKRYGKLAGRYVAKATMDHLSQIEEAQSDVFRLYREALAAWKEGKTVLNPVSHMNNVVSNLTMAHLAGVSYHRGDKYLSAILDFAKNSPKLQEAKEAGLFLGTVSDVELMNTLPKELRDLAIKQESYGRKAGRTAFNVLAFGLRRPMGWAYQNEDLFFRYLIWKDATERGMDAQDAVDFSQKYIFTYDDLPKTARRIRDFGIPFFSYTYKAVPALLSTTATHPWRMAAPAAALWAAQAAMYAMLAGDDDEEWSDVLTRYITNPEFRAKVKAMQEQELKNLPPWQQGRTALGTPRALRLGEDEATKLPLFIDVSRMVPGGDIFDVSPNAGGVPFFQWMTPSHPLFTTAVAMFGNKDLFFGKEITDSNDTRGEATEKRLAWLWKQYSPAIAVNNYHWQRTMNAMAQANGGELPEWVPDMIGGDSTGVGRDRLPVQAHLAAMQTIGIKIRPQDLDKSEDMAEGQKAKMLRELDREISVLRRLNNDGVMSDRAYEKERDRADVKKDRLRDGKTVDGDDR